VTGGTPVQIDDTDSVAVYYVGVDIRPTSSTAVTVTLLPTAIHLSGFTAGIEDRTVVLNWTSS
jgi:hypothetical protein